MGLKLNNGVEVKITDFTINNSTKVGTFTVAPKDPDGIIRSGGGVYSYSVTITAPLSMVGSSVEELYIFIKKLPLYEDAEDT